MTPAEATRPILWNISHGWLMYPLFALALIIAAHGFWMRARAWRRGQPAARFDRPAERVRRMLAHAVAQARTWRAVDAGFMHACLYWGFVVLTAATTVVLLQYDFGLPVMHGAFYLYFQSFLVDVFGALTLAGVLVAAFRRRRGGPPHLVQSVESWGLLALIFAVCLGGFLVEGWRIAATSDPWAAWSPVGYGVARLSRGLLSTDALLAWHRAGWWVHLVSAFALIAWAPYTKLAHVVIGPLNIYTSSLDPIGASLRAIDFERADKLGVNRLEGFTWKDLLDLDACTECGRCTKACPANRVGKSLSPRDIVLGLRGRLHAADSQALGNAGAPPAGADRPGPEGLIGAVPAVSPDALWACTTCAACVDACPVFIEQMPKIVDMRRYLVMEEADLPDTLQAVVRSLESRGHPFPGTQATRMDWAAGLDVVEASSGANAETIVWVGCAGALVERGQQITRATVALLRQAGERVVVLGREEKCTGDVARRLGHEFLFEQLARENIATLNRYGVKRIITACPHCFNTFRHEYPRLGGVYEVLHHTEVLAQLVREGRLTPARTTPGRLTFHDPCYLGRQNGLFEAPRDILRHAGGKAPIEMAEHGAQSFCCGGGGGLSFAEEPPAMRVNQERARQALATGADVIAAACPFCLTMIEDGVGATKGDRVVRVADIAEVLWDAIRDDVT
jgi:Fe-S oxidoreductase